MPGGERWRMDAFILIAATMALAASGAGSVIALKRRAAVRPRPGDAPLTRRRYRLVIMIGQPDDRLQVISAPVTTARSGGSAVPPWGMFPRPFPRLPLLSHCRSRMTRPEVAQASVS